MKEADKVELSDGTAHDMLNLLAAVRAYAELLGDGISGPLNDKQRDQVATILRNAVALGELIDRSRSRRELATDT